MVIRKEGFAGYRPRKAPLLQEWHIEDLPSFANEHLDKDVDLASCHQFFGQTKRNCDFLATGMLPTFCGEKMNPSNPKTVYQLRIMAVEVWCFGAVTLTIESETN